MADCQCCDCLSNCPSVSLEVWRDVLCVNSFSFWQWGQDYYLSPGTLVPVNSGDPCTGLVYDSCAAGGVMVGRREIYKALVHADEVIRNYAGYYPDWRTGWACDEISLKKAYQGGRIRLRNAKLHELGKETLNFIQTVTITTAEITDDDGDGFPDTITLTVPVVNGISSGDLAVFFTKDDWRVQDRCTNEMRPINTNTVAGNWVITFPAWMAAKPKLYAGLGQTALDPADLNLYATKFDLYQRYADATNAVMIWRRNHSNCACNSDPNKPCYTCELSDACIVDYERGIIELNLNWSTIFGSSLCCPKCISKICVHSRGGDCGYPDLVAHYADGLLQRLICCNEQAYPTITYWQADYVSTDSKGKISTILNDTELLNPFGTSRGGIEAYRFFRNRRATKAARI